MKMKLSGTENLKHFSSVLSYLKAVDKDLKMEATPHSLILRALNGPKTAYSSVELAASFFDHGTYFAQPVQGGDPCFSCKLPAKYLCSVAKNFKNCNTLSLRAEISARGYELVCELHSPNQIKSRYRFKYEEGDHLSAVFDTAGASYLSSQNGVLRQAFDHLHQCPEMIVTATPNRFQLRSYRPPGDVSLRFLESVFDIDAYNNFDAYEFHGEDENDEQSSGRQEGDEEGRKQFICCTREVKAMLNLSENVNIGNVDLHFFDQGKPIQVSVRSDVMSALLVMTTIDKPTPPSPGAAAAKTSVRARGNGDPKSSSSSRKKSSKKSENTTSDAHDPSQTSEATGLSSDLVPEREEHKRDEEANDNEDTKTKSSVTGKRMKGARAGGKPPPQKKAAPHIGFGYATENQEDEDEDEDEPVTRGRRHDQQQRRVILDDDDNESNATQPEPDPPSHLVSAQVLVPLGSQLALSNSPSLPGEDQQAVSALTDLGRKRLHSGPASSSSVVRASANRSLLDSDSD